MSRSSQYQGHIKVRLKSIHFLSTCTAFVSNVLRVRCAVEGESISSFVKLSSTRIAAHLYYI